MSFGKGSLATGKVDPQTKQAEDISDEIVAFARRAVQHVSDGYVRQKVRELTAKKLALEDTVDSIKAGLEMFVIGRPEWQTAQIWKLFESLRVLSTDCDLTFDNQIEERYIHLVLTAQSEDAAEVHLHANRNKHVHSGSRFELRTDSATILPRGFQLYRGNRPAEVRTGLAAVQKELGLDRWHELDVLRFLILISIFIFGKYPNPREEMMQPLLGMLGHQSADPETAEAQAAEMFGAQVVDEQGRLRDGLKLRI